MTNRQQNTTPDNISGISRSRSAVGRIERARNRRSTLRRLAVYVLPYRLALLAVFILVFLSTLCNLAGPYLIGVAIDGYVASQNVAGLFQTILLLFGVYIGHWLTKVGQSVIIATIAQKMMRTLRRDLFQHLQTLSLRFFDQHPPGDLMSRLTNDLDAMSRVFSQNVTELFAGVFTLVGILVAIFVLNFWLALGAMLIFPVMTMLVGILGKRTRSGFRKLQKNLGQLNAQLEEMFSAQRVIQAFGQETSTFKNFDATNESVRAMGIKAQAYAMLVPPLTGILTNANIAVIAGLGGWMTLKGLATVGNIAAFINYARNFASPLRRIGNLYNQLQAALAGAERVFEIIDTNPKLTDLPEAIEIDEIKGEVVFDHVDFAYHSGTPVIKDVSLHAKVGQTIALVGPTGAGKTTIVNLLSRFYDIDQGAVFIDGTDIREVTRASLRRQLGTVLQDLFLFAEPIIENIRYGRPDATDEECIAAAKLADADAFIRRLPQGYQTPLTERGSNLSQGQCQLLAIARVILANPSVLILDEATSNIDTRTEVHIQRTLRRLMKGRTSFVIAHRLSTIRDADQVLVIDNGRIIERGTHDDLFAQRGFYYNLYMSQFTGNLPQQWEIPGRITFY